MRLFLLSFILAFLAFQQFANGYRILGIFPIYGKSHWVMMESLMKGLAARGHQVDVYTPFKSSKTIPNYREIRVGGNTGSHVNNITAAQAEEFANLNVRVLVDVTGNKLCEMLPEFKELIKNPPTDPPYDIFITEIFVTPCYLAFGNHLKIPTVGVMTGPFYDWINHQIGNPNEPAYVSSIFLGYSQRMTYWQRLTNTIVNNLLQLQMDYYVSPHTKYVKDNFGYDTTISDLYKEPSLILVNSHHSVNGIRSFTQGVVEVGGLHLHNDVDKLEPDVQKWMDESKHGFIYFTFGSMVRIETFPKELLQAFYKAFEKIAPVRVLMKVAKPEDLLPGLPKNVMVKPWFSQIPILEPFCNKTFDGWSCWPNTAAGTTAYVSCPDFITGFDSSLTAHKYCELDGTWFRHPTSHLVWSNYTTCVNIDDLIWQHSMNNIYKTGYAISLVALLVSLAILAYFPSLRCARITLHMNLFTSFAANNALWLFWYRFVVANADVLMNNYVICRYLHVLLHYFLLTNYAWMLCEGFYLHTLLVSAFTSEHRLVNWLMATGWSIPGIILAIYTCLRATSDNPVDTEQCWINESNYTNVLVYPVCVTMLLNLLFLFNIVRVLLMKLRAGPAIGTRPSRSMLQALRATFLLVPLLGLHYLVIPFRPPKKHPWHHAYEVISAITASFQGLCVAVLFCFCNGEVIAQVKRKWEGTVMLRNRTNSCTATTVSFIRSTAGPMAGEERV